MARTVTKGGMYCVRCDRPIEARRDKHGLRNFLSVPLTFGLGVKVEGWHCPWCGGPAVPDRASVVERARTAPPHAELPPAMQLSDRFVRWLQRREERRRRAVTAPPPASKPLSDEERRALVKRPWGDEQ